MKFVKGRNNLAATVYVPYDCTNNCTFCKSKEEYKNGTNLDRIKEQLKKVRQMSISDVVFTGGEPMMDTHVLGELVNIVNNKDVYINTTLINKNLPEFLTLINNTPCIKAVNISRHADSYENELLNDIAPDKVIHRAFDVPVKINVVIPEKAGIKFFKNVIKRWMNVNIEVSFREDFTKVTPEKLHSMKSKNLSMLLRLGEYVSRTYCDVCDTTKMNIEDFFYSYHRGLETTSLRFGDTVQVNDIVVFPDGQMCYDWDRKTDGIAVMVEQFRGGILSNDMRIAEYMGELMRKVNFSWGGGNHYSSCGSGGCGSSCSYYGCGSGGC
jgi:organic radical activating enzyme